ncbi:DUF4920 domain-containing protein [Siphonobacter aquaeclarae]|uniref:DUF4920 domain-containing protein n=1 Tax=Siphonobacter aquaeclarae TaxID=563176 RepID=A0A1G9NET8_9BACT|nr:DUF4920 domain-containing protein [Siphonobacter aquaeclarae]SDL85056.1 protein of unknown function [Siphonobacter aquaeclarae]
MKRILLALAVSLAGLAAQAQTSYHGAKITEENALSAPALLAKMQKADTLHTKVTGTVESVCKVKGCWMKVRLPEGKTMRVTFRDYDFFVPKDIEGKTVVFEGDVFTKTTPVNELKHYAEDAGKSKEEIAKITQPEKALVFVADGVIVKR